MLGGGFENENIVFTIKISTTCQHFVIRDNAVSRLLQSHDIVSCNNSLLPLQYVCNILAVLLQRQRRA